MAAEDSSSVDLARTPGSDHELENRNRNLLARVRSILSRMADTEPSASDFAAHLEGRLSALWRAEDAFSRKGADLELILLDEFQSLLAPADAITLHGPAVRLNAKSAGVVILAIHELATNALKFGALSGPDGHLSISWCVLEDEAGARLRLSWAESGVSVLSRAPRRKGFGHDLITNRIAYELNGSGEFILSPGGITCLIEIPLQA